jgi:hypothetical protein
MGKGQILNFKVMQNQTGLEIDHFPQEPSSTCFCVLRGLFSVPEGAEVNE